MSLQVWLPLTEDLNNQGLADLTSSGTPSYKASGKIGAQSFDLNTRVSFNCPAMANKTTFSIAFWAKVNTDSTLSTDWVDVISFTDSTASGTIGYLRWETCYGSTLKTRGISGHDNATQATTNGPNGAATTKDVWHHIVCVVGADVKEYRDGVLTGTYTANGGHLTGAFWIGETGKVNGEIQDLRIYDEALDPLEVKRISQGLVLHYPLNDPYIEPTTNTNTSGLIHQTQCYNGATNKYGYGANTDIYITNGEFQGYQCSKIYMGTNGLDCYPYFVIDNQTPAANATNTVSFDYFPTIQDAIVFYTYNAGSNGEGTWKTDSQSGTWSGSTCTIPVQTHRWNHIEFTNTNITGTVAYGWAYIRIGTAKHTSDTTQYWLIRNVQIEAKDHATPFVLGTRNELTIYDSSGFNNNGYIYRYDTNSIIETSTDTPRLLSSTVVASANATTNASAGTAYIVGDITLTTPSQLTIAFWVNPLGKGYGNSYGQGIFCTTAGTNSGTDYLVSAMNSYDDYLRVNSGGDYYARPRFVISEGWHHYAATFDGQTARVYKDGVQTASAAMSASSTLGSFDHVYFGYSRAGGVWRRNNCQWSDCRLYTTALSADDVKALYENSAYIATDGTGYTYEFVEE